MGERGGNIESKRSNCEVIAVTRGRNWSGQFSKFSKCIVKTKHERRVAHRLRVFI